MFCKGPHSREFKQTVCSFIPDVRCFINTNENTEFVVGIGFSHLHKFALHLRNYYFPMCKQNILLHNLVDILATIWVHGDGLNRFRF
jgi:hypothetical protein